MLLKFVSKGLKFAQICSKTTQRRSYPRYTQELMWPTHEAGHASWHPILEAFEPWSKPCKTSIPSKPRNGWTPLSQSSTKRVKTAHIT
ncbi:protein of unknown function [Pseudomonas marincola]|uniref:Uncharacterized protein n=1 Tax=Pseudomonas marincola TaxID=437900 RepID=A0A8S2BNL6_9PSED|nr:protein of unknown function [Pseudomonas marincola]